MTLPPDRSHVGTEQRHPAGADFDQLNSLEAVALMAGELASVRDAVRESAGAIAAFIDALVERMTSGGRLIFVGAGTSGRLGVLDASECPPTFCSDPGQVVGIIAGGDAALRRSSEGMEDDPQGVQGEFERLVVGPADAVLAIAAGGTTPFARGAVTLAKSRGALTAFLCHAPCVAPDGCDHLLLVDTGAELLNGSTRLKAGTATKSVLNAISTIAFSRQGKVYGDLRVDLAATNDKLRDRAIRVLRQLEPALTREAAAQALTAGGWRLKPTLLMLRQKLSRESAEARLRQCHGDLRAALAR